MRWRLSQPSNLFQTFLRRPPTVSAMICWANLSIAIQTHNFRFFLTVKCHLSSISTISRSGISCGMFPRTDSLIFSPITPTLFAFVPLSLFYFSAVYFVLRSTFWTGHDILLLFSNPNNIVDGFSRFVFSKV